MIDENGIIQCSLNGAELREYKSTCEECVRQAEIIAIGMQAPLYVCEKCGKDVKV